MGVTMVLMSSSGSVVVEDHVAFVGTLKGLVASTTASETLEGSCLDGLIGRNR